MNEVQHFARFYIMSKMWLLMNYKFTFISRCLHFNMLFHALGVADFGGFLTVCRSRFEKIVPVFDFDTAVCEIQS